VVLSVDPSFEKEAAELVLKKRVALRNWLISHLWDRSVADLTGAKNLAKLRDDMKREFNRILYPGKEQGKVKDVLLDEFVVQ
jgi:flagellar basal body-associated protein FliL